MQRAQKVGEEQLDKAKQVATTATEAAKEHAERERLSQQGLDQGLHIRVPVRDA
jgi:hypothetical protein